MAGPWGWAPALQQSREVVLGDSYGSQSSLRQHFGLDLQTKVDKLIVRWPSSGIVDTFENIPANRIIEITEGVEKIVEKSYATVAV